MQVNTKLIKNIYAPRISPCQQLPSFRGNASIVLIQVQMSEPGKDVYWPYLSGSSLLFPSHVPPPWPCLAGSLRSKGSHVNPIWSPVTVKSSRFLGFFPQNTQRRLHATGEVWVELVWATEEHSKNEQIDRDCGREKKGSSHALGYSHRHTWFIVLRFIALCRDCTSIDMEEARPSTD